MTIRPAADADWRDVGALAELLVKTHFRFDRSRFFHPDRLRGGEYVAHLREEITRGHATVLVVEIDAQIVGYVFAGIEPESWKELRYEAGYIHDLVVTEERRGGGIGSALLANAIDWFDARGIARVMLWSAAPNVEAQKLFRRAGFRPTMVEMTLDREKR